MYERIHICSENLVNMHTYISKYIKKQNGIMHSKLLIAFTPGCEKRIGMKESLGT